MILIELFLFCLKPLTYDGIVLSVYESRTLTTPVELIKCLKSIKEHAFSASPYPVVITLEDHLTPDLQAKVAQVLYSTIHSLSNWLLCLESPLTDMKVISW